MRVTSIVLDLDDTLYLERDYVRSGIDAVGTWFEQQTSRSGFAATAARLWQNGQRNTLFDETLRRLNVAATPDLIQALVTVYREHEPAIALAEDAAEFLTDPGDRRIALITDGIAPAQRRKIAALGLDRFTISPLIATGDFGAGYHKPHRRAFDMVTAAHNCPPETIVYVADNPEKDFLAPRALGWRTIQIDRPGAIHSRTAPDAVHAAEAHITSLSDLDAVLDRMTRAGH